MKPFQLIVTFAPKYQQMKNKDTNFRITLVLLWVTVLFNMLFADVFSIMIEFVEGGIIDIPGDVTDVMAIAAVVTNIPILMVILSWLLPYKANKTTNVIAAILTVVYVIGGGHLRPHYVIIAGIEVVLLLVVIVLVLRQREGIPLAEV